MTKMKFTVDDGIEFNPDRKPPSLKKAIEVLNGLPFGALLTTRGLASKVGNAHDFEYGHLLPEYRQRDGGRYLYGNPKTIKALNEQKG